MRQAVLFYSFMTIFIITAIVTLLGVTGAVTIPEIQLNMLLGACLVELAGAVIALYRRTDFFERPSDNLATSFGATIEAFDQISDEIEATIDNKRIDPNRAHRFLVRRMGGTVVAYEKMQVITAEELEQLPKDQRDLIRTYEHSMNEFVEEWRKIKEVASHRLIRTSERRSWICYAELKKTWWAFLTRFKCGEFIWTINMQMFVI